MSYKSSLVPFYMISQTRVLVWDYTCISYRLQTAVKGRSLCPPLSTSITQSHPVNSGSSH